MKIASKLFTGNLFLGFLAVLGMASVAFAQGEMATGTVSTPAGSITPISRFSSGCQNPAGALPSNGTVNNLGTGLEQFNFTGFTWLQHATGGINWDLYTLSSSTGQQFLIGNWGHGCHPTREMSEYQWANGAPFAEIQDILRIHGTGPFTSIILP